MWRQNCDVNQTKKLSGIIICDANTGILRRNHWTIIWGYRWCEFRLLNNTIWNILFVGGQDVCGHPGAPANGTFYPIGATFRLGAAIRYSCDDGFILFGNEERICLYNGTWTGDIPLCGMYCFTLCKYSCQFQSGKSIFRKWGTPLGPAPKLMSFRDDHMGSKPCSITLIGIS